VSVLDADIGFDVAPVIDNQNVGDDGIVRALLVGDLAVAHAVADQLSAAVFHFLAVGAKVLLYLYDEVGVGTTHAVGCRLSEHIGIDRTRNPGRHRKLLVRRRVCFGRWSVARKGRSGGPRRGAPQCPRGKNRESCWGRRKPRRLSVRSRSVSQAYRRWLCRPAFAGLQAAARKEMPKDPEWSLSAHSFGARCCCPGSSDCRSGADPAARSLGSASGGGRRSEGTDS